ncbi:MULTISPECIES: NAD(P)H-dependent oxidoreductase [Burkholderia]|uniref:NAD(P)H-dependent oxidoreductase n=1 Tax=Burkholderia TaxID=32008 RepID=UPI00145432C1|nr:MULTISPECIES: NAD(P)H-dependent oxidoreductase [Burkholderia]VWM16131.1 FMN-dependent NADH-azoreductase 1 [Burkholderia lata]
MNRPRRLVAPAYRLRYTTPTPGSGAASAASSKRSRACAIGCLFFSAHRTSAIYDESGVAGTLEGKQVYLVTASGGVFSEGPYAPFDYQSGYLKHLLGFIGMTDIREVRVEGTVLGAEAVQAALAKAGRELQALVEQAG